MQWANTVSIESFVQSLHPNFKHIVLHYFWHFGTLGIFSVQHFTTGHLILFFFRRFVVNHFLIKCFVVFHIPWRWTNLFVQYSVKHVRGCRNLGRLRESREKRGCVNLSIICFAKIIIFLCTIYVYCICTYERKNLHSICQK